ncbi:MAG: quinohemoprotein amine dehydrogenase subunit alpha [Acidobacteria bacterium]|nr:quinohemoprotein amine dehydrogenase subunit alpha [Acidobacteriota bacterium]
MRSLRHAFAATASAWVVLMLAVPRAQQPATDPAASVPAPKPEVGIPIPSPLVQKACGPCHTTDEKQQISRISFQRNTPEGWQDTLKRMVALNDLQIDPQTAREVVKYLSNHLGLAPEEAAPAAFEVERRLIDYKYASNDVEGLCNRCHSLGRVISQRRARSEWDGLIAMHRGWYPLVDRQAFRRMGPAPRDREPDGRPPDTRHPVEKAIDHLSRAFPLQTPEWSAWSATMRPARLDGTWALTGWDPGKGAIYGRAVITPVAGTTDEFTTEISYTYARSGKTVARAGRAVIYTGFQWRGRSTQSAGSGSAASGVEPSMAAGNDKTALREVMFVERDWRRIAGRWFTGGYDEQGLDVRFERLGRETHILGTDRTALPVAAREQSLRLFAANLPATLQPGDVDLGPGLSIVRIDSTTSDGVTLVVNVAANAAVGPRDIVFAGVAKPAALTVYDRIDAIRVAPSWNMARVGGVTFPKMFAQFEAWGYHNGLDGKPDTPDDLKLDLLDARWTLEEYTATYDDDDVKFVGELDEATGLFTPNIEGPNAKRRGERNNIGDVWVVATYMAPGSTTGPGMPTMPPPAGGAVAIEAPQPAAGQASETRAAQTAARSLRARAHLLVTVPLYMRWDPSVMP